MKKFVFGKRAAGAVVVASALLLMVECSPKAGKTTRIAGQFAGDAPEAVRLLVGDILDTTVTVTDGRFEVEIPTVLTRMSYLRIGNSELEQRLSQVDFVADGSVLTYEPETKRVVSSDKKGLQSRFSAFNEQLERVETDFKAKIEEFGDDEDALDAYAEKVIKKYNRFLLKTAKANRDNVLGAKAIWNDKGEDAKKVLALIESFSPEMQADPTLVEIKETLSTSLGVEEGSPFVDFTVVQDPDDPENSTVRFSDYIGKGKYVLVDFWSTGCRPCWDIMPKLIDIYNTYHGENFDMLSVAMIEPPEVTKQSASQMGIVWNQIVNSSLTPFKVYGFDYMPCFFLFGPDGTILKREIPERKLEKTVKKALGV